MGIYCHCFKFPRNNTASYEILTDGKFESSVMFQHLLQIWMQSSDVGVCLDVLYKVLYKIKICTCASQPLDRSFSMWLSRNAVFIYLWSLGKKNIVLPLKVVPNCLPTCSVSFRSLFCVFVCVKPQFIDYEFTEAVHREGN